MSGGDSRVDTYDPGTAEWLRKGQGEILKVRFGNVGGARVLAEWQTTNMGTGWHISSPDNDTVSHLAFLGSVPWKEAEKVALEFVRLLEAAQGAKARHIEATGRVRTLAAEIKGRQEQAHTAPFTGADQ